MREWKGIYEGYTTNFINNNLWKLQSYEFLDLYGDCFLLWNKLLDRYKDVDDKAFMAIYKTSIFNMLIDKSRKEKLRIEVEVNYSDLNIDPLDFDHPEHVGGETIDCEAQAVLNLTLDNASEDVREVIRLALDEDETFIGTNTALCKRIKRDRHKTDVEFELKCILDPKKVQMLNELRGLLPKKGKPTRLTKKEQMLKELYGMSGVNKKKFLLKDALFKLETGVST